MGSDSRLQAMTEILRPRDVCKRLRIGKSTLYIWLKERDFPPSIQLGPRIVGWRARDIDEWIERKAAEAGAARTTA